MIFVFDFDFDFNFVFDFSQNLGIALGCLISGIDVGDWGVSATYLLCFTTLKMNLLSLVQIKFRKIYSYHKLIGEDVLE